MLSKKTIRTMRIFMEFLRRDFYVHTRQLRDHIINYALIYPLFYIFCFAYLQTQIYFHGQTHIGAIVFSGTCLVPLMAMAFHVTFDLLFDLEKNRYTDFQIMALNPHLLIIEQILFSSVFTFCVMAFYFPLARIFASSYINMNHVSWPSLYLVLYCGSLCVSSYHKLAATLLTVQKIAMFWTRINYILLILGGFWIPLYTIRSFSPTLGLLLRLNPIVYLTEGLRQSIVGGNNFLPVSQCVIALLILTVIFTALTCHYFKKRVDHI